MKKIILLSALLGLYSHIVDAQALTERVDDATIYKMGNRPTQGTKVINFGLNLNDTQGDLFSKYNLFQKGNLLNAKYFISDRTAIRGGLRISQQSSHSSGNIDTSITGMSETSNSLKEATKNFAIVPGVERHFAYSNFFDVYVGGDLYMGYNRTRSLENHDYSDGFYDHKNSRTTTPQLGLGGVIGLNVFVLDLPISVGLEYGLMGIWNMGGKTHVTEGINDPLGTRTNNYYTQNNDPTGNPDGNAYSKLKKGSSNIDTNNNLRVLLNIYFK